MSVGLSIRQGFAITRRRWSVVLILFLANLAVAALAGLPIYYGIQNSTGYSLMGREMAGGFSVDWLTDFSFNSPGSFGYFATVITYMGVVSLVLNSILAGGVLPSFKASGNYSWGDFFRQTRLYGWRLLRLLLIGLIGYWIVFKLLNEKLGQAADRWANNFLDDRPVFWVHLAVTLLIILCLGFINLVMDYARVRLVREEGTGAVEAFLAALGFAFGRFWKAIGVYIVPALLGLALLGFYRLLFPWGLINSSIARGSHTGEPLAMAALLVVQQAVMFGRYWFRVATWASEWSFYTTAK
jgi:hypothetical protein